MSAVGFIDEAKVKNLFGRNRRVEREALSSELEGAVYPCLARPAFVGEHRRMPVEHPSSKGFVGHLQFFGDILDRFTAVLPVICHASERGFDESLDVGGISLD